MTPASAISASLRKSKIPMFAERKTTDEVLQWAHQALPKEYHAAITTALMMYHNTVLEQIATTIDKEIAR